MISDLPGRRMKNGPPTLYWNSKNVLSETIMKNSPQALGENHPGNWMSTITFNEVISEITKLNPRPGASLGETIGRNLHRSFPISS
ncbi:hypothetical protein NXW09_28345 [Bacteroides ovatus]|nr:hypothetical protein [Bacteroides ovatus]